MAEEGIGPLFDSFYVEISHEPGGGSAVMVVTCPICGVHHIVFHIVFDELSTIGSLAALAETHRCSGGD